MDDNNVGYIGDGLDCWYNHSVTNPKGYHFCSAITRKNLYDLGGFDERFARARSLLMTMNFYTEFI